MRIIWIVVILVSACSPPPRAARMAVDAPVCTDCRSTRLYKNAIALDSVTSAPALRDDSDDPVIDEAEFRLALLKSLGTAGLLVPDHGSRQYVLDVEILDVRRPESGLTITAFVRIGYELRRSADRRLVHRYMIDSKATRRFSDSVILATRSRMSLESAVRRNIHEFLSVLLKS